MARQRIPKVTPYMVSQQPDQLSAAINQIIDTINDIMVELE